MTWNDSRKLGAGSRKQSVAYLGRGHHGERVHDAVRILLADLRDEQRAQAGAGAAAQRVGQLEALQAVAALGLLADDLQHGVDQLGALCVVALGPVVACEGEINMV